MKIFENTDVFEDGRLLVGAGAGDILLVAVVVVDVVVAVVAVVAKPTFDAAIADKFDVDDECIDICDSSLLSFDVFCVRFIGIGGGKGIFNDEGNFSASLERVKWIDELDDDDDDGEVKFIIEFIGMVADGSSSIEFDATIRSRSFRTSRTVRWNNCWTYS